MRKMIGIPSCNHKWDWNEEIIKPVGAKYDNVICTQCHWSMEYDTFAEMRTSGELP